MYHSSYCHTGCVRALDLTRTSKAWPLRRILPCISSRACFPDTSIFTYSECFAFHLCIGAGECEAVQRGHKKRTTFSRLTLRPRLSTSVHTRTRPSHCPHHPPSMLVSWKQGEEGWFLLSVETILDLARTGPALSNNRPRVFSLPR